MNMIALESAPMRILTLVEPSSTDKPLALTATAITKAANGIAYEVTDRVKPLIRPLCVSENPGEKPVRW
ncbi:hypothetical protein [Mesorhizobium tamadayense]|uniref:hypothetical protein n=1 Tax=Mesorhizobium tamadayense TaxID=425306 RepID=UPI001FE1722C|nr:hypothetical protein [Mesorhizobium tamadayense]